ncbi:MAG TPA: cyanophycinase [Gemmatimonadaceae bacterium]|nr:cyanophycinase [Gemmatimonadaceae bacterium]
MGGACTASGDALGAFVNLAGAATGGPIIGITSASQDVRGSAKHWETDFQTAGAGDVAFPIIETREDACNRTTAKMIARSRGVFLGGGNQIKLITLLSGTPCGDAIWDHFASGGVVCGTSAGAAALTEMTLAGNEVDEDGNLVEQYIGPGLGLLTFKTLIDTHFSQRRRLYRLFVAIAGYPDIMGLGIDEDTAMVVRGEIGKVVGKGGVTFVDGRTVVFDNSEEVTKGRQLTLSSLRVGMVGTGYTFNLRQRELEAVLAKNAVLPQDALPISATGS